MNEKVWHYTSLDLCNGLKKFLEKDDIVFVHTSFGTLGSPQRHNTSEEICKMILNCLMDAVGEKGTILVPTYTYSFCKNEIFDVEKTPSTVGAFTEYFRKYENVLRSSDPIFSVAGLGPKAKELLTNLPHTCFGVDSIHDRLIKNCAKICMIGLNLEWSTFRHHAEEMVGVPFRYKKIFSGTIKEGEQIRSEDWTYYVRMLIDNALPDGQKIEKIARELHLCQVADIGKGQILVIGCKEYFDLIVTELRKDPWLTAKGPPLH